MLRHGDAATGTSPGDLLLDVTVKCRVTEVADLELKLGAKHVGHLHTEVTPSRGGHHEVNAEG